MGYKKYSISVNVSAVQMQQRDFSEIVAKILDRTGILPEHIELEITETVNLECSNIITMNLMSLQKQEIKLAIDDFGTGYNSLKYLQNLGINHLKIDKTFINNFDTNVNQATWT